MPMTQDDYDTVANVIRPYMMDFSGTAYARTIRRAHYSTIAVGLALEFAARDPKFDVDRFLDLCGVLP